MAISRRTRWIGFSDAGVAVLIGACPVHADDVTPRVLIDTRLQERVASVSGIDGGDIRVVDDQGQVRTLDGRDYVGFIARYPSLREIDAPAGVLELTDGQRFVGTLMAGQTDDEVLRWNHASLGTLRVPLEEIADIVFSGPGLVHTPLESRVDDEVILANGDRISGFVEQIGDEVIIESGGAMREVPRGGVSTILLANPVQPMAGAFIWLADGSVVSILDAQMTSEGLIRLTASLGVTEDSSIAESGVGEVSIHEVQAAAFDAGRLVALGRLTPAGYEPASNRRWSEPPTTGDASTALLGAAIIEIPGPMSVWWDLPEGVSRLGLVAELPVSMQTWGDCEIIVEVGGDGSWREKARERLNADRPEVRINVTIDEPGLRIRVDEGRYGPIQDHVRIVRALLLVD
jgi:hypothetical protein